MSITKERIDVLLVKKGLIDSREKAQKAIMAGLIYIDNNIVQKAGTLVSCDVPITVKGPAIPYVSRGGLKLEKALNLFDISVKDKVFLDIGASTGGFTDCLLQNGASKVYAIDVGYGQFDYKLRQDDRVVLMERTNIRYVEPKHIPSLAQGAVIDVSFISLKLVLPVVMNLILDKSHIITLIKPQFEAGRKQVGKRGVIREQAVHKQVLYDILRYSESIGLEVKNISYSPITGPKGNIEFLAHLFKGIQTKPELDLQYMVETTVQQAHHELIN